MMYNNNENSIIRLRLYDISKKKFIDIEESMSFNLDMRLGNGLEPIRLTAYDQLPKEFSVSAAYPNPFNPTVNFDVNLNKSSYIKASIYNIKGQNITNVFEGNMHKGFNRISWDAAGYSSGVYFINIESNGEVVSTQKISLLK